MDEKFCKIYLLKVVGSLFVCLLREITCVSYLIEPQKYIQSNRQTNRLGPRGEATRAQCPKLPLKGPKTTFF